MIRRCSIHTLIIGLLVGAILITATGILLLVHRNHRQSVADLTDTFIDSTTVLISELVAAQMAEGTSALQDLARSPELRNGDPTTNPALARQLAVTLRHRPNLAWVSFSRLEDGAFVGVWRDDEERIILNRSHPSRNRGIPEEQLVQADGSTAPVDRPTLPPYDPRDQAWFQQATTTANLVWTDVYTFHEGRLGVSSATSVVHNGQPYGVLTVDYFLEGLSAILEQINPPGDGDVFLFYRETSVIAPRDVSADREAAIRDLAGRLATGEARNRLRGDRLRMTSGGETYLVDHRALAPAQNPGWSCAVVIPEASLFRDVRHATRRTLAITLIILAGAVAAASFLAHRLTLPLRRIARDLASIGHGGPAEAGERDDRPVPRDLRVIERAVEELRANLEERAVQQRRVAQAEQLLRDKADVAAMISHEIRTPLQTLVGYADLLTTQPCSDEDRTAHARTIAQGSQELLGLLNNLLDLFKLDAGKMAPRIEPIDLTACVREAVDGCRPRAEAKPIALRLEAPDIPVAARTDRFMVHQIVVNLVTNAIKFTDTGSVTVRVGREDGFLRLSVTDSGIGMDPTEIDQALEAYRQASPSIAARYGGTGLGLTICRRFVDLLGGRLDIHSEPGQGTEVRISLPEAEPDSLGSGHA